MYLERGHNPRILRGGPPKNRLVAYAGICRNNLEEYTISFGTPLSGPNGLLFFQNMTSEISKYRVMTS